MKTRNRTIGRPAIRCAGLRSYARRLRRGYLSLELVMVLPILGVVLMGLFEFSMLFFARGSVVEASRIGARTASLPGADRQSIEAEIRKVLSPRLGQTMRITVDAGERTGDVVAVGVSVPMGSASPDLLWPVGYSLAGRNLYCETRMIKE
jgi:hypothetical protein